MWSMCHNLKCCPEMTSSSLQVRPSESYLTKFEINNMNIFCLVPQRSLFQSYICDFLWRKVCFTFLSASAFTLLNLRRPALSRCHSEQGEHGVHYIIVMEVLSQPLPVSHLRSILPLILKELPPGGGEEITAFIKGTSKPTLFPPKTRINFISDQVSLKFYKTGGQSIH